MDSKVPSAVDTADDCVDGVFEPLCNPIHGESDKYNQANDGSLATVGAVGTAVRVVGRRLPSDVDTNHGGREPGAKSSRQKAADEADNVHMAVFLADVDAGAKHKSRKRNTRNPGPKGKGGKEGENEEDDTGRPVLLVQVVDGGSKGKHQVENTSDPDKGLGEGARKTKVSNRENKGRTESAGKENQRVGVDGEGIVIVDALARSASCVAAKGNDRDSNKTGKYKDELDICI